MNRTIESGKTLSSSHLWRLQELAYEQFAIGAWQKEGVPFYLTSNPYTVHIAATLAAAYLEDIKEQLDVKEPIYLFDLGAGSGRFAFLFLKMFLPLARELIGKEYSFRYVMTEIADETIAFWQRHPYFKEWFAQGTLDCAHYHHAQKEPLFLLNAKSAVATLKNPPLLFANYFFDTIPQDLFRVRNGALEEGRVSLSHDAPAIGDDDPAVIKHLQCSYSYLPLPEGTRYYPSPSWNRLLDWHKQFEGATFLFPKGAFQTLDFFSSLSGGKLFLFATDQGVVTEQQLYNWGEPRIDKHGTFSVAVSYHAIAQAFREQKGAAFTTSDPDPLFVAMAATLGSTKEQLPHLSAAFLSGLDAFEPKDYWLLGEALLKKRASLQEIALLLKLGRGDPVNTYAFLPEIAKAPPAEVETLRRLLALAAENLFPICEEEWALIERMREALPPAPPPKG